MKLAEVPIYGAGRLGIDFIYESGNQNPYYQLTDHLGNVRAVVGYDVNGTALAVQSYADYYPFGWKMPGRQMTSGEGYRYGYQGEFAEEDEETGWNQFELRMYDSRIGRWMSTDPANQYPSPYLAMGNNPITGVDPSGSTTITDQDGNVVAVYDDGSTEVHMLSNLSADHGLDDIKLAQFVANAWTNNEYQIIGKTRWVDEFINPLNGKVMKNQNIDINFNWLSVFEEMAQESQGATLYKIALNSFVHGEFDLGLYTIQASDGPWSLRDRGGGEYRTKAGMFDGYIFSSQSAGDWIAGYLASRASAGRMPFDDFQRIAGELHYQQNVVGEINLPILAKVALGAMDSRGGSFPYYGENYYQYRNSIEGWISVTGGWRFMGHHQQSYD